MNNITIGQYIPGNSILHRADPRTKLIATILYMVMLFVSDGPVGLACSAALLIAAVSTSKVGWKLVLRSLKTILIVVIFTAVINLLVIKEGTVLVNFWLITITTGGVFTTLRLIVRLFLLIMGVSLLTFTTTPISLTDGIETMFKPLNKIKVPVHDIAMMMTIAIRFVPPLMEEAGRITRAQASRGADYTSGGLMARVKGFFPILLPMIVGAFTRADQLADAMEARCYRGGEGRTKFNKLAFTKVDVYLTVILCLYTLAMILAKIFL
ncbi:MAG: energy-coupling factor transporter transmembrane protein EcfT [Clostridia bacterium]|nr:energy-coupling factor transporter transmembrane protein EcfT [Clostridia bacterium]